MQIHPRYLEIFLEGRGALCTINTYKRKKVSLKLHFKYGWTCKKDRNKAGMEKLKNTTLLLNDGGLHSGFQRNALASLVHFVVYKVHFNKLRMQVHCIVGHHRFIVESCS